MTRLIYSNFIPKGITSSPVFGRAADIESRI